MIDTIIEQIDPRKIVNQWYSRPILLRDEHIVREGFLQNGYVSTYLISCRVATVPEIQKFFEKEPHGYTSQKAAEVARTVMRGDTTRKAGDYRFCYDGHIRKSVSIQLMNEGALQKDFKLKSELVMSMPVQDEIAYGLSRNAPHSFCVPLSFLATLLRCHDYDVELNIWLRKRRQKCLSATEVARRLVSSTTKGFQDDKAMKKRTETKRQILGISRKLPSSTVEFLRKFICNDEEGLQMAFTLANMRAVPRTLTEEEFLMLMKRFIRYYQDCLPSPKPLLPKDVSTQVIHLRRAIEELEKFKKLCEYDEIPNEMHTVAERITATQMLDLEMQENAFSKALLLPLETACRNLVPNGTNHLEIARKNCKKHRNKTVQNQFYPTDL